MKHIVPILKVDTYEIRTPYGPKKIDVVKKVGSYEEEMPDNVDVSEFVEDFDVRYEGSVAVMIGITAQQTVPHTIRFIIKDVNSVEEAFSKFDEFASKAANEFEKEFNDAKNKMDSQIIVPENQSFPNY